MKKALLIFSCASLLACAGTRALPIPNCNEPIAEEIVCYNEEECTSIMHEVGGVISYKMRMGLKNRDTKVDVNVWNDEHGFSQIGEFWVEQREERNFFCVNYIVCDIEGNQTEHTCYCKEFVEDAK